MNLAAACGWTLLRSLVVALVAVPVCWGMRRQLAALSGRPRTLLWTLLLVPFFTPPLLTGYAYSSFSLSLIRHPGWNEALYAVLVGLRFLAAGVLVMHFAPPPPVSEEALHCAHLQLCGRRGAWQRVRILWPYVVRGPWRVAFPAAAVIFLLVFQEFETASLMGVRSWTVWLFDAQAGGLMLGRTLRAALLPVGCELLVLTALLLFAFRSQLLPATPHERPHSPSTRTSLLVWGIAIASCLVGFGVPLAIVGAGVPTGLTSVLRNRQMLEEITVALGFGLASGMAAAVAAGILFRCAGLRAVSGTRQPQGWTPAVRRVAQMGCVLLCLPGMMGSLSVSLVLLWLFQRPGLYAAYDTPLPAVLALVLFLLPRGALVLLVFEAATLQYSVHAARLMGAAPDRARRIAAAELFWQMRSRRLFFVVGMLSLWGYLELTPVSILAPPGLTSAPVRLYNLMHYGRSMVLSAMVMLTMLTPLGLFAVAALVRKPLHYAFVSLPFRRERP